MTAAGTRHKWEEMLRFFTQQNIGRNTRLGTFEGGQDYWLESGLGFQGIDLDGRGDLPSVQISLDGYTRSVDNVTGLSFRLGHTGEEDGIDITDRDGNTTLLRFELEKEE